MPIAADPRLAEASEYLDASMLAGRVLSDDFEVRAEQVAAYAEAVGDPYPQRRAGREASPTFSFVPFTLPLFATVRQFVGEDGVHRLVHTHQEFELHRLLRADDQITISGWATRLHPGPFGAVMEVISHLTTDDGELVTTQHARCLVAGAGCGEPLGEPFPPVAGSSLTDRLRPTGTYDLEIPPDLTVRYAAASGDNNPIHLDPARAQAIGFPGVIVHGMATLARAVAVVEEACGRGATPVRLCAEFVRPVFPGDHLTVRWRDENPDAARREIAFEVHNRRRRPVLRSGILGLGTPDPA